MWDGFGIGVPLAFLKTKNDNLYANADLRRRQTDTSRCGHGVEHVLNQGIELWIIEVNGSGDLQQSGITHAQNSAGGHGRLSSSRESRN